MMNSQCHGGTSGRQDEKDSTMGEMAPKVFPASQSHFHSFSSPKMKWGCQRILRCVNSASEMGDIVARSMTPNTRPQQERNVVYSPIISLPKSPQASGFKEKEVEGATTGAVKKKDTEQMNASAVTSEGATVASAIPWNLRKRKGTCDAPQKKGRKSYRCSSPSEKTLRKEDSTKAAMQGTVVGENGQQRKYSISLSREEIEEDFYLIKGRKPEERPKKRPKDVQKQLDALVPGSLLAEITKDMYKFVK